MGNSSSRQRRNYNRPSIRAAEITQQAARITQQANGMTEEAIKAAQGSENHVSTVQNHLWLYATEHTYYMRHVLPHGAVGIQVMDYLNRFSNPETLPTRPSYAFSNNPTYRLPPGSGTGHSGLATNAAHLNNVSAAQHGSSHQGANTKDPNAPKEEKPKMTCAEGSKRAEASKCAEATGRLEKNAEKESMLKSSGMCPKGFDWLRHANGWRCWGGNHFVFDNQQLADEFIAWLKTM